VIIRGVLVSRFLLVLPGIQGQRHVAELEAAIIEEMSRRKTKCIVVFLLACHAMMMPARVATAGEDYRTSPGTLPIRFALQDSPVIATLFFTTSKFCDVRGLYSLPLSALFPVHSFVDDNPVEGPGPAACLWSSSAAESNRTVCTCPYFRVKALYLYVGDIFVEEYITWMLAHLQPLSFSAVYAVDASWRGPLLLARMQNTCWEEHQRALAALFSNDARIVNRYFVNTMWRMMLPADVVLRDHHVLSTNKDGPTQFFQDLLAFLQNNSHNTVSTLCSLFNHLVLNRPFLLSCLSLSAVEQQQQQHRPRYASLELDDAYHAGSQDFLRRLQLLIMLAAKPQQQPLGAAFVAPPEGMRGDVSLRL
jgi:hypothetical protein